MNAPILPAPLMPGLTQAPNVKVMPNIGSLFDIPTGKYLFGKHGESILNGGLGFLTGVVGIGNNFKSTVMHYMALTMVARMGPLSGISTYDTEINIHEWHLARMQDNNELLFGENLIDSGRWQITDKTVYHGDQWYDQVKDFMNMKIKEKAKYSMTTPFLDRDGKPLKIIVPTGLEVDSMSEFVTQDVIKMQDENSLGESGANTVSMRQGLQKNRFLMEIPALSGGSYTYVLMSAHIGSEFSMDPRNPPPKKLQHLKGGVKLKGVPEKFTFVMNNCWHCYNAAPLINQTTKAPEYPRDKDDDLTGDTDLNEVTVRQLRSKSGPSGMAVKLIVSQQEGVLPSLTEFHFIKEEKRWGLGGNVQNYFLEFCPDIALSRTAVRRKIDAHPELRRGLNLASEMLQIAYLWHDISPEYVCTPKELYDDLIKMGYDWKVLLDTRGWWAPEGIHDDIKFLSTMDFLRMRTGEYIPYWMSAEEKAKIDLSKAQPKPPSKF
jgi:hypothetical protein